MVQITVLTDEQVEAERRAIVTQLEQRAGTVDPRELRENAMRGRYDDEVVHLVRRMESLDYLAAPAS